MKLFFLLVATALLSQTSLASDHTDNLCYLTSAPLREKFEADLKNKDSNFARIIDSDFRRSGENIKIYQLYSAGHTQTIRAITANGLLDDWSGRGTYIVSVISDQGYYIDYLVYHEYRGKIARGVINCEYGTLSYKKRM